MNKHRPFQGQQYTFAVITTTQRSEAVEIATSDLEQGKLHQLPSYVNPWSLHEIDHGDIHKRVPELSKTKQKEVATEIKQFVSVP